MTNYLTERLSAWIEYLAQLLARAGVPEPYRELGAMGILFGIATIAVLVLVYLLLRLTWRKKTLPPEEEAREEAVEVEPFEKGPIEPEAMEPETGGAELPATGGEPAAEPLPPEIPLPAPGEIPKTPPGERKAPPGRVAPAPASLFERMRAGLAKTQSSLVGRLDSVLRAGKKVDADLLEELEEILVTADFGMKTTQGLIQAIEKRLSRVNGEGPEALREVLKEEIRSRLHQEAALLDTAKASPFVIMVVGVNGVGKTTTIGKLARQYAGQGKKVLLGAGDTFRAAAAEQLSIWGERAGVDVIRHAEGADPAAVAFDAAKAAVARKADILILDTAGRLHTKVNLMEELKKVQRVLAREIPGAPHETLLVLDATTGQNGLVQARLFKEAVEVSGIALTKLDGTAKGGVVVAIGGELNLPVRFVGIGEGVEDLRPFEPDLFVDALFQRD